MVCPHCHKVIFDPPRTTGPRSQNRCLNGWIQFICNETGEDFDRMKLIIKARAVKRGFPPPVETEVEGEIIRDFKSEARCTMSEIMCLIDEVKEVADFAGIVLPVYPDERKEHGQDS